MLLVVKEKPFDTALIEQGNVPPDDPDMLAVAVPLMTVPYTSVNRSYTPFGDIAYPSDAERSDTESTIFKPRFERACFPVVAPVPPFETGRTPEIFSLVTAPSARHSVSTEARAPPHRHAATFRVTVKTTDAVPSA